MRHHRVVIGGIAAAVLALHLATNAQYDFHRDSLYYLDSARHLALGYVDYPPVTPLIARMSLAIFGASVWGLRLWPSLAGACMVVLVALIARELGGGRAAQVLAAVAAATSLVLLGANWLFQTVTFDQVTWLVTFWLLARLLRTGDRRMWIAIGVSVGVGLETKYTILGLVAGIAVAVLATPLRTHLRSRWPWLAALAALVIAAPNIGWQIANGWPSITYTFNHQAAQSVDFSPVSFLAEQLSLIGPVAIPVWILGLWWLLRNPGRRPLGIAAAVAFVLFLVVGKGYYIGPVHPMLLAAGACAIEAATANRRRWLRGVTGGALALQALVLLPIALPLLPESVMATSSLASIRTDFADTVGWPDLVHQVAQVYDSLPAAQQRTVLILTNNYGEAGAIDTEGVALGLPQAHSGELTYYYWLPRSIVGPVIAVGFDPSFTTSLFSGCTTAAHVTNRYNLHNQEYGVLIERCQSARLPAAVVWERIRSFQ